MINFKQAWESFWRNLSVRDQRFLMFGGGVVVFYVAYLCEAGLTHAVSDAKQMLLEKKSTLAWMQQAKKEFHATKPKIKFTNHSQALAVFSNALKRASFNDLPYQLEQVSNGALQLAFERVPYRAFLGWLWEMSRRYEIDIQFLNVVQTETPGLVKLTLTLSLPEVF